MLFKLGMWQNGIIRNATLKKNELEVCAYKHEELRLSCEVAVNGLMLGRFPY